MLWRRIYRRLRFCYHWRAINKKLVCLIALKMSQNNHYHLMISFSKNYHTYYFVQISAINAGTALVEDLTWRIIMRWFRFFYYWRAIDIALVRSKLIRMSKQTHSHLMFFFLTIFICILLCISILSKQSKKRLNICYDA